MKNPERVTMNRKPFAPQPGTTYWNQGGMYECVGAPDQAGRAIMRNLTSGWTFYAHDVGMYDDGSIDWSYSSGGHF